MLLLNWLETCMISSNTQLKFSSAEKVFIL